MYRALPDTQMARYKAVLKHDLYSIELYDGGRPCKQYYILRSSASATHGQCTAQGRQGVTLHRLALTCTASNAAHLSDAHA